MDADRALKGQRGQALLELLLLAPLFLAIVLATLFFVRALSARLTLIQACRDTALGLARDEQERGPQAVLEALVQERNWSSLGRWSAQVESQLLSDRLSVKLDLPTPAWLPGGPWRFQEQVSFKRDPWKAPYAKAFRDLLPFHPH